MTEDKFVLVTDWELVDKDDFYLENNWLKERQSKNEDEIKEIKELVKYKNLYIGYIVKAINYCIYCQMDAQQVLINSDGEVIIECESAVINNNFEHREEYEY